MIKVIRDYVIKLGKGTLHKEALEGIIDNYIVDSDYSSDIKYTKWSSGLTIITINRRIDLYDMTDEQVTLPFALIGQATVSFGTSAGTNEAFRKAMLGLLGYVNGSTLTIGKTVRSANTQTNNQAITIVGYWK